MKTTKLAYAVEKLEMWQRKIKLARKRVQKFRRMVKYHSNMKDNARISKAVKATANLPRFDKTRLENLFGIELEN